MDYIILSLQYSIYTFKKKKTSVLSTLEKVTITERYLNSQNETNHAIL